MSRREIVLGLGIEVTAETAQSTSVRRRHGHLEKADTVPENLDPDVRADDHVVDRTVDAQSVIDAIRKIHPLPVYLHPHFLTKIYFQVADLQRTGCE